MLIEYIICVNIKWLGMAEIVVIMAPVRRGLTVHLVASARDQLEEIHGRFSAWTDPLSLQLHDWCATVLEGEVAEDNLSNELWAARGRVSLTELAYEILVNSIDRAPLSNPVYIRANGAVLEPWMVSEFSNLFGCYPLGRTPCDAEPHTFAEEMVRWLAPLQPFFESSQTPYLSPLSKEALLIPETRKARAGALVHGLIETREKTVKRESALAIALEREAMQVALLEEKEALMLYISTEVTRLQLASQNSLAKYERRLKLVGETHGAERDLLQVRLDRAAEKARAQAEVLRLAQEQLENEKRERERLAQETIRQRREIDQIRHDSKKRRGGCLIS